MTTPRLFVLGGLCGVVGTLCYFVASTVDMGPRASYALVMSWPVLSVIFLYALTQYLGLARQSPVSQLAFVFGSLAFAMVAAMISIQLAVKLGIEEYIASAPQNEEFLKLIRRSTRLVDLGLDVAWDIFIGAALILLSFPLSRHNRFGAWWGVPTGVLGALLIALNVSTYPWPPNTRGLFDIGPFIALFLIALGVRLLLLGIERKQPQVTGTPIQEELVQ